MSDEDLTIVTVPRRRVMKGRDDLYFVCQYTKDCGWIADGRGYPHSTSAYAKLGRINSRDANELTKEQHEKLYG